MKRKNSNGSTNRLKFLSDSFVQRVYDQETWACYKYVILAEYNPILSLYYNYD